MMRVNNGRAVRRISYLLMAALVGAISAAAPVNAEVTRGPACTNIIDGGAFWDGSTLFVQFILAKPACSMATYTVYATTDTSAGTVVSSNTYTEDVDGNLIFALPVPDPDPATACDVVSFYGTTSIHHHVADRAPDTGYAQAFDDGVTGACGTPSRSFH